MSTAASTEWVEYASDISRYNKNKKPPSSEESFLYKYLLC